MAVTLMDGFDHYVMDIASGVVGITTEMAAKGWQRSDTGLGGLAVGIATVSGRMNGNAFEFFAVTGGLNGTISVFKQLPTAISTITAGFACRMSDISAGQIVFRIRTAAGAVVASVRINADGSVSILNSGGTVIATSATGLFIANSWHSIEVKIVVNGASGSCEAQIDGTPGAITTTTGNFGSTAAGGVVLYADRNIMPDNSELDFDDLYVTDSNTPNADFLGDCHIETLFPNAAGTHNDFTPNSGVTHYTQVDDTSPDNDTTYNAGNVLTNRDSYNYPPLSVSVGDVKAVQTNLWARKSDAGYRQVAPIIRTGGTTYTGTTQSLSTSYIDKTQVYDQDPTSSDWTISTVNAAEFGVEVA